MQIRSGGPAAGPVAMGVADDDDGRAGPGRGRVLVGEIDSPVRLLRALGDVGDRWADPVAPMISLLALLAETLVAYLLVVLALRSLCLLPGSAGRVAGRVTLLVTPVVVRRLLDLLVGGTLLAQATLVATSGLPPGRLGAVPTLAMATSSSSGGHAVPVPGADLGPPGSTGLGPLGIKQSPPGMGLGPPGTGSTRPGGDGPGRDAARSPPVIGATAALTGGRAVQPAPRSI